jgi:sigma-B regulation protein RsbU (phosphoserine phosphatase)
MPRLIIRYADDRTSEVQITDPEIVIGRDQNCDVPLEDTLTSRRHARLYRDDRGRYWLQDLASKNGTLLNGKKIATARIRSGDEIGIGTCLLTLSIDDQSAVVLSDATGQTTLATTSAWGADQRLDLPQQRLEKLYELNERLTGRFDRDDLLGEVLDICVELLNFERAGIALWQEERHQLQWIKIKDLRPDPPGCPPPGPSPATDEFCISRSLVNRALHDGERILITDTAQMDPTASMISNRILSAMCVPLEYHQQVRGVIYGDRITSTGGYTKGDIDFLAALGRLGAMGLVNAQLVDEIRHRHQLDMQLQMGRQIQARLFPSEPLLGPGLTIDALNDPGQQVSGDHYDYFRRRDGLITVVIADVAGKGIPASLLMANLQAAVHVTMEADSRTTTRPQPEPPSQPGSSHPEIAPDSGFTQPDLPPSPAPNAEHLLVSAVDSLNRLICRNVSDSRFITGIFALLDPAARTFAYLNAGHPAPYLLRPGGRVEQAEMETTFPLGIEPDLPCYPGVLELSDTPVTLFMFTDGVHDAENEQGQMFGQDRLLRALQAHTDLPPADLVTRIRHSIKQFTRNHPPTDDITMVAIRLE